MVEARRIELAHFSYSSKTTFGNGVIWRFFYCIAKFYFSVIDLMSTFYEYLCDTDNMRYTDMQPGKLYQLDSHLYCVKDGKYYWLPYDQFSRLYILPWKSQDIYAMGSLNLRTVTARDHSHGIDVVRDGSGKPIKFDIRTNVTHARRQP